MSRSEGLGPNGQIIVEAPLGVEIAIADGAFRQVARGVTRLESTLPEGVYAVQTRAAGESSQEIIRLRAGDTKRLFPKTPQSGGWLDPSQLESATAWLIGMSAGGEEAAIALLVSQGRDEHGRQPSPILRVQDNDNKELENWRRYDESGAGEGRLVLWHSVAPGVYTLRFQTADRRLIRQTIYAPPGRLTVVLFKYGLEGVIERAQDDPRIAKRSGIDPSRTVIVSISLKEAQTSLLALTAGTAEILLHFLRTRPGPIDLGFVRELVDWTDDPYLWLYAATAALAAPGAPLERLAAATQGQAHDSADAIITARKSACKLGMFGSWPDVQCLLWRLEGCDPGSARTSTILAPPALEICWRWAAAASTAHAGSTVIASEVAVEAKTADPNGNPWFVLRTASRGRRPEQSGMKEAELQANLQAVSELLGRATVISRPPSPGEPLPRASLDLESLSPESESVAKAMLSSGGALVWSKGEPAMLKHLAASLAAPASSLGTSLRTAEREIRKLIKGQAEPNQQLWMSDPHKGQFGGQPTRCGNTVRLEKWDQQIGLEFLALHLLVEGQDVKGPITFYLHPTFSPSTQQVFASDGAARFTCYAWGAFTLGVELSNGFQLELDLAALPELPTWFRSR